MTEQEIIKRLQDNKKMGTIYFFLPEPVKDYLLNHKEEKDRFLTFDSILKEWCLQENGINCLDTSLYALSDFEPNWEEFVINKEGKFRIIKGGVADTTNYSWWDWAGFLANNKQYSNFGGWFYGDSWELSPNVTNSDGRRLNSYVDRHKNDIIPVIPTRIRFWRFRE